VVGTKESTRKEEKRDVRAERAARKELSQIAVKGLRYSGS